MASASSNHTIQVQGWLDRLREGDEAARESLLEFSCERLMRLTRKMLRRFERVRRWEQTDDVLQSAMLRLHRTLAEVRPESPADFYRLAALNIRRELLDLAKHYFGPCGAGGEARECGRHRLIQLGRAPGASGRLRPMMIRTSSPGGPSSTKRSRACRRTCETCSICCGIRSSGRPKSRRCWVCRSARSSGAGRRPGSSCTSFSAAHCLKVDHLHDACKRASPTCLSNGKSRPRLATRWHWKSFAGMLPELLEPLRGMVDKLREMNSAMATQKIERSGTTEPASRAW